MKMAFPGQKGPGALLKLIIDKRLTTVLMKHLFVNFGLSDPARARDSVRWVSLTGAVSSKA